MGGKRGASLRQEEETDPPPPTGEVRQTVPKRSKQETAASSSTQHLPVHPLDHLPRPALSRIVFHTSDIKQKLRLALTCRRLYNIVTRDAEAWPATVFITHGCINYRNYNCGVIRVSVSDKDFKKSESEERQLLSAANPERLLTVLHLPAVCPVPVELHMQWDRDHIQEHYYLTHYVLPSLEQYKADNSLLFSNVHIKFDYGKFESFGRLLYVWCDTGIPVSLRLHVESAVDQRELCELIESKAKKLTSVERLSMFCVEAEQNLELPRLLRLVPNVTDIEFELVSSEEFWDDWVHIWASFVASRAEPTRPHTMRVVGGLQFTPELAEPIEQLQPGHYVGISNILRQTLDEHLGQDVLESIEEQAEVKAVTLPGIQSDTFVYHDCIRKHLLTLHLLMKNHQQAEWTIIISGDCDIDD